MKRLFIIVSVMSVLLACHSSKQVVNIENYGDEELLPPPEPIEIKEEPKEVLLNDQIKKGQIDLVVYEHNDGSIPDEYKRDYSIRVYRDSIRVNIWGSRWSDTNFRRTYPSTPAVLEQFLEELKKLDIRYADMTQDMAPGGTGGTTGYLRAYAGEDCVFNASAYFCHGLYGTLQMNSSSEGSIEHLFQKQVPESMEKLFDEAFPPKKQP